MHFVEVLDGCRQLRQHRSRVSRIHVGHVVALEGVHEAFGPAVTLRAAQSCRRVCLASLATMFIFAAERRCGFNLARSYLSLLRAGSQA
jgi:hypothetical protein